MIVIANHPLMAVFSLQCGMLGEELGDLRFDRLGQQGTLSVAQDFGERVVKAPSEPVW